MENILRMLRSICTCFKYVGILQNDKSAFYFSGFLKEENKSIQSSFVNLYLRILGQRDVKGIVVDEEVNVTEIN